MYGSCAGREVNMQHKHKHNSHYIPCFHIRTLYRFTTYHTCEERKALLQEEYKWQYERGPTVCIPKVFTSFSLLCLCLICHGDFTMSPGIFIFKLLDFNGLRLYFVEVSVQELYFLYQALLKFKIQPINKTESNTD